MHLAMYILHPELNVYVHFLLITELITVNVSSQICKPINYLCIIRSIVYKYTNTINKSSFAPTTVIKIYNDTKSIFL